MISVLLVTHGKMATGMKDSMQLILGEFDNFDTVELLAGMDFNLFKNEIRLKIKNLDKGQGVLIFVDMSFASPYNACVQLSNEIENSIKIISGVNLPLLLNAITNRENYNLDELADLLLEDVFESIENVKLDFKNNALLNDEDDY